MIKMQQGERNAMRWRLVSSVMRHLLVGALVAIGACAPATAREVSMPVPSPPMLSEPFLPPATDLTGAWATGTTGEPPPGPVRQRPTCAYNPPVWIIKQEGNALQSWAFPESYNQGIARADPVSKLPPVPGMISGSDVVIADAGTRIVLRYDSTSGHLRGSRNGNPFWAARQVIIRESCPGIP